jgi:hypothetical protein
MARPNVAHSVVPVPEHLQYSPHHICQTEAPELQDFLVFDDSVTLVFDDREINLLRDESVDRAVTEYLTNGTFELPLPGDLCDLIAAQG